MLYVTAQDLQGSLIRMLGGNSSPEEVEAVRKSIREALRTVSASHNWPCYHGFYHLTTNEQYVTGTVTYTAATRVATLSGGSYPSWAAAGVLILDDDIHARVQTRNSATSVTLMADDAPADDYTGEFTIYRYQFEIDGDLNLYKFGKLQGDQTGVLEYVPPDLFETDIRRSHLHSGGRPRSFTVSRGRTIGRTALALWPWPTEALRYRFGYIRHPRDIKTWEENTGTVSTASGSTAVTGQDTAFAAKHVNCLLRVGESRNELPTSRDGRQPAVDESVVTARTSNTAITVADELTTTASEVAFTLSDILDYDVHTMHEVITYAARRHLGRLRNEDMKLQAMHEKNYQDALYLAKCQSGGADTVQLAARYGRGYEQWPGMWDSYYTLSG